MLFYLKIQFFRKNSFDYHQYLAFFNHFKKKLLLNTFFIDKEYNSVLKLIIFYYQIKTNPNDKVQKFGINL